MSQSLQPRQERDQVQTRLREDFPGHPHDIYQTEYVPGMPFETVVPEGHFFMMGDNRDGSYDSRAWGAVPERWIVGRGEMILWSWSSFPWIAWSRLGQWL